MAKKNNQFWKRVLCWIGIHGPSINTSPDFIACSWCGMDPDRDLEGDFHAFWVAWGAVVITAILSIFLFVNP